MKIWTHFRKSRRTEIVGGFRLRFLHCEPNLEGLFDYVEETDSFYADPNLFLRQANLTVFKASIAFYMEINKIITYK